MNNLNMTDGEIINSIKEILDIEKDITLQTDLNIFEYDSFAKINLIIFIETYSNRRIDIESFLMCDTFFDLLVLIKKMKGEILSCG